LDATERNEVKGFGFLEPLQAVWNGVIVTPLSLCRGPAHRDKAAMNGAQLSEMSGPPAQKGLAVFGGDGRLRPGLQNGARDKSVVVAAILKLAGRPVNNLDIS
jgi:hypothetical protein